MSLVVRRELGMGSAYGGTMTQAIQAHMDVQDSKVVSFHEQDHHEP